jgi:bacteriocin-like protein
MSNEKKPQTETAKPAEELSEKELENVSGGAVDMFLKISGIKGEVTDTRHKDEIHIESFSLNFTK